jgi:YbbR domain-containing protein
MAWHPFRNIGLKVAALALGTLLWFTVSGQQVERRLTVPVFYRNLPASLEMTGDSLDVVTVQVRGGDNLIGGLQPGKDLFMVVDLAVARSGQNVLPLRIDQVTASLGIKVMQVDPGTVTLTLERSGSADVPIRPTIEGEPAAGFAVTMVTVEPRMVQVVGPESRLRDLSSALTERLSVEGRSATFSQDVSVGVADAQLRLTQASTVRITVQIGPAPADQRMVEGVVVEFRRVGAGRRPTADPPGVTVVVRGQPSALSGLMPTQLVPYVDLAGKGPGSYNLPVRIELPAGFTLANLEPATISVRIR